MIALMDRLTTEPREHHAKRPPLNDLFAAPVRAGTPVIFSVQRPGRNVFGGAGARGRWEIRAQMQTAPLFRNPCSHAPTELPGTITNGNTPRGVFTIVGAGTATNKSGSGRHRICTR